MALIAIASDKGAPGVTTAALALAAVWPRPVLLAECDQAGGDLVYRFPAAGGGHLDPRRGVLSLAVVARRGMQPQQVWEHVQKLHGGLDVLAGVTNAEQGAGLSLLWGPIGKALAALPQADVIADCGRLGADGPLYDLLIEATTVVLVSKVHVADVIRLRDRAAAFAAAAQSRGRRGFGVGVVVVAEHKKFRAALGEVQHVLGQANAPATVLGGIAHDTKGADLLSGEWGGNLDRTMLIKTAREVAQHLAQGLPPIGDPAAATPGYPAGPHAMTPPPPAPVGRRHAAPPSADSRPSAAFTGPRPAAAFTSPPPAAAPFSHPQLSHPQLSGSQPSNSQLSGPQAARSSGTGPEPAATRFPGPQPAFPSSPAQPNPGPQGSIPPGPQNGREPGHVEPGYLEPDRPQPDRPQPVPTPAGATPDLAAVTLSAPTLAAPVTPAPIGSAPAGSVPTVSVPTVSVPTVSASAPRTTFSRVLGGRTGRHQADQAPAGGPDRSPATTSAGQGDQTGITQTGITQTGITQTGITQTGSAPSRPARHAAPAGGRTGNGSAFPRPPMPPLTPPGGQPDPEDLQNAEDFARGSAPWQRQEPLGPAGSPRPGGE
jgi:hypothetical protein